MGQKQKRIRQKLRKSDTGTRQKNKRGDIIRKVGSNLHP